MSRPVLSCGLAVAALPCAAFGLALTQQTQRQDTAGFAQPAAKYEFEVRKNVMVPMPDGVRLATDLYLPKAAGEKLPVILIRTPYNKEGQLGMEGATTFFAGQGYAVVVQDTRGRFQSEGEYTVEVADADDSYHTMDWIVTQPWTTGKIGTYGCSYLGEVQYLVAQRRHPNHAAMIAKSAAGATGQAGGYYTNFGAYDGGAFTLSSMFGWFSSKGSKVKQDYRQEHGPSLPPEKFGEVLRSLPIVDMGKKAGFPPTDYEDFVTHAPADPYWNQMNYLRDDSRFNTPAIHVDSWLDLTPEQTLHVFNLMRRNAESPRARDNQFVIMSPTAHCRSEAATAPTKVGAMEVGDARLPYWNIYLDWFDYWLKGKQNGVTGMPKVRYFAMHNGWRSAPSWPVPGMRSVPYYLSSSKGANTSAGDGVLATVVPARPGKDTYFYDPEDPLPSRGGSICCTSNPADQPGIFDQTEFESRRDLLVYSTPVLERGVTIAGPVRLILYVSSDAKDTDFTAKLVDVDSQGRAWNVTNGVLRARYRQGMQRKVLMQPGSVYRIEVNLKSTAYDFAPGHRIRVHLTSSDFPMYDRNLNTGGNNYDEKKGVTARNTIHHSAKYPSHIMLPVAPVDREPSRSRDAKADSPRPADLDARR